MKNYQLLIKKKLTAQSSQLKALCSLPKMPKIIVLLSVFFILTACESEEIEKQKSNFIKLFGSTGIDVGTELLQTADGFILLGTISNSSEENNQLIHKDITLIKTDEKGNQQWIKTYGDTLNQYAVDIKPKGENFLILANYTDAFANKNILLFEVDAEGNEIWQKKIDTTQQQEANALAITETGEILITGSTTEANAVNSNPEGIKDVLIMKNDAAGNILWRRRYGGSENDYATDIKQKQNGGLIIIGTTYSFSEHGQDKANIILIETNVNGYQVDRNTYGTQYDDYGKSVIIDNDNSIIFVGDTYNEEKNYASAFICKITNNIHQPQWINIIDEKKNVQVQKLIKNDNYLFISGHLQANTGEESNTDIYLLKTNLEGTKILNKMYGFNGEEKANSLLLTNDHKIGIIGSSNVEENQMIVFIKVNINGEFN